jgi:hypothetical protein
LTGLDRGDEPMSRAWIALAVLLAACQSTNPSGLSKDKAIALLEQQGYTDVTIGPDPSGWKGYALMGGYKTNVLIDNRGVVEVLPPD